MPKNKEDAKRIAKLEEEIEELEADKEKNEKASMNVDKDIESLQAKKANLRQASSEILARIGEKDREIKKLRRYDEARELVEKMTFHEGAEIQVFSKERRGQCSFTVISVKNCDGLDPGNTLSEATTQLLNEKSGVDLIRVGPEALTRMRGFC